MSCNGCRVLRKGCSDTCILRPSLQLIESPEAQGHATVFVAKFFGRAGLMSFISSVPENQRPALFQSLLYEAAGRTVNPVNGAVGLLGSGNWHVCQAAVDTVLCGGKLRPIPEFSGEESENVVQKRCRLVTDVDDLGLNLFTTPCLDGKRNSLRPGSEESVTTTCEDRRANSTDIKLLNLF